MQRDKILEELLRASNANFKDDASEQLRDLPLQKSEEGFSFKASPEDLLAATDHSHLISEDMGFDYNPEYIQDILLEASLDGFGGACGQTAVAINDVLFDNKGELVAAVNKYLWQNFGDMIGHVAVKYGDDYWDAEGLKSLEEIESWGMLDPQDPDYDFSEAEDLDEAAYDVIIINPSTDQIKEYFGNCDLNSIIKALEAAQAEIERAKEASLDKKSRLKELLKKAKGY